jgi:hypothetical protein
MLRAFVFPVPRPTDSGERFRANPAGGAGMRNRTITLPHSCLTPVERSDVTLSGMADAYSSHNFNQPPSDRNRFRAFDTHDDKFRPNLAKLTTANSSDPPPIWRMIGA